MTTDDISIRLARDRADFDACVRLQREVLGLSDMEMASVAQLISATHVGGTLHVASAGDEIAGFVFAFPGLRGGEPHLHSEMLAVKPEHQQRGVGVRLKWAQREEALARGLSLVTSTFDPLHARSAHLNLRRLGATAAEFLPHFFGGMIASLHRGLPSDRLFVRWDLAAPRVVERHAAGDPPRNVPTPDLPRVNDVRWQAGWPVSSDPDLGLDGPELLLEIPPDFDVLCQSAPRVAETWHGTVGRALAHYLGRGYVAADFVPTEDAGRRRPFYLLRRP